jgi:hypothetical protein
VEVIGGYIRVVDMCTNRENQASETALGGWNYNMDTKIQSIKNVY